MGSADAVENPPDFEAGIGLTCLVLRATRIVPPVRSIASGRRTSNMRLNRVCVNPAELRCFLSDNHIQDGRRTGLDDNHFKADINQKSNVNHKHNTNMVLDLRRGIS